MFTLDDLERRQSPARIWREEGLEEKSNVFLTFSASHALHMPTTFCLGQLALNINSDDQHATHVHNFDGLSSLAWRTQDQVQAPCGGTSLIAVTRESLTRNSSICFCSGPGWIPSCGRQHHGLICHGDPDRCPLYRQRVPDAQCWPPLWPTKVAFDAALKECEEDSETEQRESDKEYWRQGGVSGVSWGVRGRQGGVRLLDGCIVTNLGYLQWYTPKIGSTSGSPILDLVDTAADIPPFARTTSGVGRRQGRYEEHRNRSLVLVVRALINDSKINHLWAAGVRAINSCGGYSRWFGRRRSWIMLIKFRIMSVFLAKLLVVETWVENWSDRTPIRIQHNGQDILFAHQLPLDARPEKRRFEEVDSGDQLKDDFDPPRPEPKRSRKWLPKATPPGTQVRASLVEAGGVTFGGGGRHSWRQGASLLAAGGVTWHHGGVTGGTFSEPYSIGYRKAEDAVELQDPAECVRIRQSHPIYWSGSAWRRYLSPRLELSSDAVDEIEGKGVSVVVSNDRDSDVEERR
ncbi:hypothetical protein B0H19DRAFT_1065453 [Mycena capillaripes]|nr:hypothetical protein B0H19DRAFT_1065453 [Mycena capillaripes]